MRHDEDRCFAKGSGRYIRYKDSEILLFYWEGGAIGTARYIPHVKRYARNGKEYASLAALLRGVASEHKESHHA